MRSSLARLISLILLLLVSGGSLTAASWRNYRLNASHTAFLSDEMIAPADLSSAWDRPTGNVYGSFWSIPAVAGNTVYVSTKTVRGTFLEAFSLKTGERIWEHPVTCWYLPLGPVLADNEVLISLDHPARVEAYDARTGDQLWSSNQAGTAIVASIPVVAGNHVYVEANSSVYAFSLKDGSERWRRSVIDSDYAPAVSDDGLLFVNRFGLDAVTGDYLWYSPSSVLSGGLATPSVGDLVYMADRDWDDLSYPYPPMIQALEPATGQIVWRRSFRVWDISDMALAEGVLYFTDRSLLRAIDAHTGQDSWTLNVNDPLWYPPVVAGDYLFTGSLTRTYAVHIPSRTVVWQVSVAGQIVISDGWVLISAYDGTIHAFHAPTE
jgi:outer membrane protein assembly factor BamB